MRFCLDKFPYDLQEKWDIDYDVYNSICRSLRDAPNRYTNNM